MLATHNRAPHEVRIFEDANVLRDRRQGDRVGRGELRHGRAACAELIENPPPDRMGDRRVNGIEPSSRIFNHLVEHSTRGGVMSDSKARTKTDSRAVALALSHLEAWTNQDFDTVRGNLANDVQFYSPAANLAGIDEYMDAPRGLTQFARQVVPGSLRVIAAKGDERNALIMYEVSTEGGPIGSKVFPSAQTWLLDDSGKIKVERIVSYVAPRSA
jgi:hypothetical protein